MNVAYSLLFIYSRYLFVCLFFLGGEGLQGELNKLHTLPLLFSPANSVKVETEMINTMVLYLTLPIAPHSYVQCIPLALSNHFVKR